MMLMLLLLPLYAVASILVSTISVLAFHTTPATSRGGGLFAASGRGVDDDDDDDDDGDETKWTTLGEIARISTPWMTLLGENLLDSDTGRELEHWRVERDDSAIILTVHRGALVFPRPMHRPGVGGCTLDFPGGRIPSSCGTSSTARLDVARNIVRRELCIPQPEDASHSAIVSIDPINLVGWPVNSSFNNQRLFGFHAILSDDALNLHDDRILRYETSASDIDMLLSEDLACLQCRSVLLEWLRMSDK